MVDDRASPSAGWREVYDAMDADPDAEEPTRPCPDCGRRSANVLRDAYECEEHGVFRASSRATGSDADSSGDAEPDSADRDRATRASDSAD